jgi:hypothetical protein
MSELPDNTPDQNQEAKAESANPEKIADSIGVFIQPGGVANVRDIILNIVSLGIPDTSRQWIRYGAASLVFTIFVGVLGVLSVERANHRRADEALILDRAARDKADPRLMPVASKLRVST